MAWRSPSAASAKGMRSSPSYSRTRSRSASAGCRSRSANALRYSSAVTGERVLFLFIDGVGLAQASPANPLATLPTPALRALLGGPLTLEALGERPDFLLS